MPLRIGDIFRGNARSVPRRCAAAMGGRALTHGELDAAGNRFAHALRGRSIGRGDRADGTPLIVALNIAHSLSLFPENETRLLKPVMLAHPGH